MPAPVIVHLVPHTHWDREWYLPFQTFRARLVRLVDGLLEEMARDERVRFTLDGQMATVDDYLEIRPEAEPALAALVQAGRLSVGPWHILMDEALVSGETIIRNLELGWQGAERLGPPLAVGYLPDMFGHIAQMPQILRHAGIGDAVVWRGVPAAIDRHVFAWVAPDGSEVRCEYLYGGYGNARDVFVRPDGVAERLDAYRDLVGTVFGDDELLAMYGEDHSIPLPGYAALAAATNAAQDRYRIVIETLAEYLEATRERSLPTQRWHGELRSGARANVLMGVVSHHGDVRVASARAERTLERLAEPLAALYAPRWPDRALSLAWRRVIEDSAHDSICACSADEVVAQVLVRFAEAEQLGRSVVDDALAALAPASPSDGWLVVSPSPVNRTDLVELAIDLIEDVPADARIVLQLPGGAETGTQELSREHAVLDDVEMPASEVVPYLRLRMHGREIYRAYLVGWSFLDAGPMPTVVLRGIPDDRPPGVDVDALLADLSARAGPRPSDTWRLRVERLPHHRVLAAVPVPALGWIGVRPVVRPVASSPVTERGRESAPSTVRVSEDGSQLSNGRVGVVVAADGTLTITGSDVRLTGVGRMVDGGDAGDSYNHAPPPRDRVVESPEHVTLDLRERGPLRGRVDVIRRYRWPVGLTPDLSTRDDELAPADVTMVVELRAGEPFVRLRISLENPARDHRLRFHVPLPGSVDGSWAEGQFAVVHRGLELEGGHGERPTPSFPAYGLAAVDGCIALLDAVTEYEVLDGRELALTVLRATGLISRDANPWRADPAGPQLATPSAQRLGPVEASFALLPHRGAPDAAVLDALETYRLPLLVARGRGPSGTPLARAEGVAIEGRGVVMSSLRLRGTVLELRVVNETSDSTVAIVRGEFTTASDRDLLGRRGETLSLDGDAPRPTLRLALQPWEIRTVALER